MNVGVMGITKRLEAEEILRTVFKGQFIVGVLVSDELFNGGPPPSQRFRYPARLEDIPDIFAYDERAINYLKFNWRNRDLLMERLFMLAELTNLDLDGLILPGWPSPEDLIDFKFSYPLTDIILDVPRKQFDMLNDYKEFVNSCEEYKELIEGVALEARDSEGNFDPLHIRECLDHLSDLRHLDVIIYGLDPKKVSMIKPLLRFDPDIIFEDEVRLEDDHLGLKKTKELIKKFM